ncbi:ubiquitin-conjugating enzyme/RWD-like protein [Fusarium redolens]|uniref:E2 ubiquitin-conjugating enzyme n=1 Tax=Fusarium redolens TaxID=48865 RepID=A0A9P9GN19_FUSRE|nr:ubiquitin-conjugating enzyme/RWD-like protein [Fusarium redolens]KAH7240907.1 ubiquitin-conjugating enzyme/RWD-like protein [Fusarium redolens]
MSTKRITKEFAEISQNPPEGFTVSLPPNQSIHTWHVTLTAPESTPYYPGKFGILLTLPTEYPFKPPVVKFVTRIYHPNVTNESPGNICLGLLKPDSWKPSTKLSAVLEALRNLLIEPQIDSPLEERIAQEYQTNRTEFDKAAKTQAEQYAMGSPVFPTVA